MTDPIVIRMLEDVLVKLGELKAAIDRPVAVAAPASKYPPLTDADIEDPKHDREIRNDPKMWKGPSYAGRRMSQIPDPAYLLSFADLCDWKANKDAASSDPEVQKKAGWNRLDGERARLFAARLEASKKSAPKSEELFPF